MTFIVSNEIKKPMWEQIRANKQNSIILLIIMALVLVALGAIIGFAFGRQHGLLIGLMIALGIYFIMMIVSLSSGDQILLASSGAKRVTPDVHPMLFNVVEEMTIAANMPKMPKIYIIDDPALNAFATGRSPETASVAVTAGLLGRLNRDELQGVMAHEISHILHRDILFVTLAGVMLGSIVLISQVFLRGMFYSSMGSRRRYSSNRGNSGGGQAVMIIVAIVFAILAPIMAQLLYFALSRRREYLADAGAVRLSRYPEGLAGALEKIANYHKPMESANKVTAPMYISNPFRGKKGVNLLSTHPPIEDRIKILRTMSRGASFRDYSDAYSQTVGGQPVMPASALKEDGPVEIRQGDASKSPSEQPTPKKQNRDIGDIMRKVNGFAFVSCGCGLKMKIPPDYRSDSVKCPRCGRQNSISG